MESMIIQGIILIIAGGASIYKTKKTFEKINFIKEIPTSKIRSAAVGLIELEGKFTTNKPIKSLVEGEDKVLSGISVYKIVKKDKSTKRILIYQELSQDIITIDDGTGKTEIKLDLESLKTIKEKQEYRVHVRSLKFIDLKKIIKNRGNEPIKNVFKKNNISIDKKKNFFYLGRSEYIIEEFNINEGKEGYVMGYFKPENNRNLIFRNKDFNNILIISDQKEEMVVKHLRNVAFLTAFSGIIFTIIGIYLLN